MLWTICHILVAISSLSFPVAKIWFTVLGVSEIIVARALKLMCFCLMVHILPNLVAVLQKLKFLSPPVPMHSGLLCVTFCPSVCEKKVRLDKKSLIYDPNILHRGWPWPLLVWGQRSIPEMIQYWTMTASVSKSGPWLVGYLSGFHTCKPKGGSLPTSSCIFAANGAALSDKSPR